MQRPGESQSDEQTKSKGKAKGECRVTSAEGRSGCRKEEGYHGEAREDGGWADERGWRRNSGMRVRI